MLLITGVIFIFGLNEWFLNELEDRSVGRYRLVGEKNNEEC